MEQLMGMTILGLSYTVYELYKMNQELDTKLQILADSYRSFKREQGPLTTKHTKYIEWHGERLYDLYFKCKKLDSRVRVLEGKIPEVGVEVTNN